MTTRKILCLLTLPAFLLCGEVAAKDNKSKAGATQRSGIVQGDGGRQATTGSSKKQPGDRAITNDIKIGNKSQFVTTGTKSAGGATAARAKSTSPSLKATTATRGRPQSLNFKQGRFKIKN